MLYFTAPVTAFHFKKNWQLVMFDDFNDDGAGREHIAKHWNEHMTMTMVKINFMV